MITYDSASPDTATIVSATNGPSWIPGVSNSALLFISNPTPSSSSYIALASPVILTSSFTLNFWFYGTQTLTVNPPSTTGTTGSSTNQGYAFAPSAQYSPPSGSAALFVSVGVNVISIFTQSTSTFSPVLVWTGLPLRNTFCALSIDPIIFRRLQSVDYGHRRCSEQRHFIIHQWQSCRHGLVSNIQPRPARR